MSVLRNPPTETRTSWARMIRAASQAFLRCRRRAAAALVVTVSLTAAARAEEALERGWNAPPPDARLRAYWWWLNGNVTKESITRDLEQMAARGFGGALICDAGGAEQRGNAPVPHGPDFASREWRELYRHALREAARLGLEMSLTIQSGWNLGGPQVTADDAVKKLTWSEAVASGPGVVRLALPAPKTNDLYYRDLFVVAFPIKRALADARRGPLANWEVKALHKKLSVDDGGPHAWFLANSAPDTTRLVTIEASVPGEEDTTVADVLDLTDRLAAGGTLAWEAPAGDWQVLRFGCTLADSNQVSTSSEGWRGYAIDVFDEDALRRYWDAVVEPLIADAGPLAGTTLRYLHTDSWEIGVANWTPRLQEEFRARRAYDLLPWLPALAGRIVNSRGETDRFLHDFRKTLGDLAHDRHYQTCKLLAARHGLGIHPESGGPHFTPIDAQRLLGLSDVPMSEFWAESATHRSIDETRFFVKQPASAAHTCGRRFVAAEGFTTVGPHWQETLWDNLKPSFDHACSEGLNRLVWHAFVSSPREMGSPGQQYFAGTHLNPNVTWWDHSTPFFMYLNRCQFLLQQGLFIADALYYYGDHVPNFTQSRSTDPARLGYGYDYDVISEEVLLERASVRDGRLVLPDGMSYRVLVLAPHPSISLPVLRKVRELVAAGATVVGAKPVCASGLSGFPQSDAEVKALVSELWGTGGLKGRVVPDTTARQVLSADGVAPDFEFSGGADATTAIDFIHRRDGSTDIYFVSNRGKRPESISATFRVADRAPELWDPVSGARRFAKRYEETAGRTAVPLDLPAAGSVFVIFRAPAAAHPATGAPNSDLFTGVQELRGPWAVSFDPEWGGPASITFDALIDWTHHSDPGIKFYSGTAKYRLSFDLPATLAAGRLAIDLGAVREIAVVRLNGSMLATLWAPPFRVMLPADALRDSGNLLEIDVVNFWPNRIIGDAFLPQERRRTRTNVRNLTPETPLMSSGLLGPVRLIVCGSDSSR